MKYRNYHLIQMKYQIKSVSEYLPAGAVMFIVKGEIFR